MKAALIFQDRMVIQREKPFVVWGWGAPGEKIIARIQGQQKETWVLKNGQWKLTFAPLKVSFDETMELWGASDNYVIRDIAVGEVWLAGGQSNMEFFMRYDKDLQKELEDCHDPNLRFFDYPEVAWEGGLEAREFSDFGFWRYAAPEQLQYFSAVAYYFAKNIRETLDIPVGIIGCNWGGTRAVCWMDESYAKMYAGPWLEDYEKCLRQPEKMARAKALYDQNPGNDRAHPFDDPMSDRICFGVTKEETEMFVRLGKEGDNVANVLFPEHPWRPCGLYHTMLEKLIPYGIRGVLWYQGESDEAHADIYARVLQGMILYWRSAWGEKLPFIMASLAPFGRELAEVAVDWPVLRAAQMEVAAALDQVWLVSTGDVGLPYDIHPKEKKPVGERMALMARGKIYGEPIVCEPPCAYKLEAADNAIRIVFKNTGTGLMAGREWENYLSVYVNGAAISREEYCLKVYEDYILLRFKENAVFVEILVQFAWMPYFEVDLYNSMKIPALPFSLEYKKDAWLYKFNANEEWFKKLYRRGEGDFLLRPMNYGEYAHLMEEHPDYLDLRKLYKGYMVDGMANYEYSNRTKMPQEGCGITIVKHERYSYTLSHTHDYIEAAYVLSGRCHQYIGEQEFWLEPGDFCILAPNTVHCISAAADDAIVFAILIDKKLFNSAFLDLMQDNNILSEFFASVLYSESASPYILFQTGKDGKIRQGILDMYEEVCHHRRFFGESILLYFRLIMIQLVRRYEMFAVVPNPVSNHADDHITAVLGYIEANYKTVTLGELAEFFNYNESYLSRMIKQYTGKTFPELVGGLQMKEAWRLLTATDMGMSAISQEVGCFDASHFYRKFKKYYGKTPAQVRGACKHRLCTDER